MTQVIPLALRRYRRDDAVAVAPTERDFSLESPLWLFSYHLREIEDSRSLPLPQ
ncbi:MAG: hypothetical protein V7K86_13425 [Nostoc sp.]|uniref:hypothetical protein n=1 Tax=Nostoc sp. TaxID=1180 RepID=UPI002FF49F3C